MASWGKEHMLVSSCTPPTWLPMSSEFRLVQLSDGSHEYDSVCNKINSTLDIEVQSVVRVQNPYLWGCYQLKKLEYEAQRIRVKEVKMFHCTAESNINSIAANNLNWRKCTRSKFGKGVSFSPSAEYANKYANFKIGCDRALILATVLVGNEIYGNQNMNIPPKFIDTSVGIRNRNGTMVYVKYCDYEFYPLYVAYYTSNSNQRPRAHQNQRRNVDNCSSNTLSGDNSISRPIQGISYSVQRSYQNTHEIDNSIYSAPRPTQRISYPPQRSYQYIYGGENSNNHVARPISRISNPVQTSYQCRYESSRNTDWSCVLL